jgi:hypothetical protein
MKIYQVKNMKPMDRLVYWITQREKIRLAKEAGEPRPWTDDEILQSYRFCNVRRMDDKVSKWLLENWYEPYFDYPNILKAVALARFINKPESLGVIERHVFAKKYDAEKIKLKLRQYRDAGNTVFNGAYLVRGNSGNDKIEAVVDYYVQPLGFLKKELDVTSMEATHARLIQSYGLGSFMAGQIVADLRWAMEGSWEDKYDWAPKGPGSQRGLNRLLGLPIKQNWEQSEFCKELVKVKEYCVSRLPKYLTNRYELADWQSSLCEIDKFSRALLGEGKPKQNYPGGLQCQ